MLSFNKLGKSGRLGNQMFQYAAIRGISANKNYDWIIPPPGSSGIDQYGIENNYCIFETFKLPYATENHQGMSNGIPWKSWMEFHFNEDLFNNCPDNVNLDGYFQTGKYFKNIEDEIREDFTFNDEIYEPCKEIIDGIDSERKIFLHLRKGDPKLSWAYCNLNDFHPVQTWDYYKKALSYFPDDVPVLVFSDHIEWCKDQEFFESDRFIMSETTEEFDDGQRIPYFDLCLMSMCTDAIIANSSFSWWGAWLINDPSKTVVAPKNWFGPKASFNDTKDLYPDGWITI